MLRRLKTICGAAALCIGVSTTAWAQNAESQSRDQRRAISDLVTSQLRDTSFITRFVARDLLKRASTAERHTAARLYEKALHDTSVTIRGRALEGIRELRADASPAAAEVITIVRRPNDPNRTAAIYALSAMGQAGRGVDALRAAAADTSESIRMTLMYALPEVGDTATARQIGRALLQSASATRRLNAATELAKRSDASAVAVLESFLNDTSLVRRRAAIVALGAEGPKAAHAVPALVALIADSGSRRSTQGAKTWTEDRVAPYAAWALSRIIPIRSARGGAPLRAYIDDSGSMRSDGMGAYAWGVDSVAVFSAGGLFMHLGEDHERGPLGPNVSQLRRSVVFDLSRPVQSSGAIPHRLIRENEAQIWIWYRRDPRTNEVISVRQVDVSDSVHVVERVELRFRVNGVLHFLQMGPFVEGQGGGEAWMTGVTGDGTTTAQLIHPANDVWIVTAPPGSIGRLWSFEDRAHAKDRGLYSFSFQIRFVGYPSGPDPCLVENPSSCGR